MKEYKECSLYINADLGEAFYKEAMSILVSELQWTYSIYPSCSLHVSYFNSEVALEMMARFKNCEVVITPNLRQDEWIVESSWPNKDNKYIKIYSPGALA